MEKEQRFSPEKKEKPPFLYHASPNREIEKFEPRALSIRDPGEGPVVFATPDFSLATTFLVSGTNDRWVRKGKINDVPYIIIGDRKLFMKHDKGGSIYKLPSGNFTCHPQKGMGEDEWVSKEPVAPVEKTDVPSALEAMIENGVQVFFVDKDTFNELKNSTDWIDALKTLESENQRRGKNVVKF